MKSIFLIFAWLLIYQISFGQSRDDVKEVLNEYIYYLSDYGKADASRDDLFYSELLDNRIMTRVVASVQIDTNYVDEELSKFVSFNLSKNEKDSVSAQTMRHTTIPWNSGVLNHAKLLSKSENPLLNAGSGRQEVIAYRSFYAKKTIIEFSEPVFLRNNTICMFYYSHSINGIGVGQLVVLKKQNGHWKQYLRKNAWTA